MAGSEDFRPDSDFWDWDGVYADLQGEDGS